MCFKPATRRIRFVYSLGVCSSHGVNPEENVESQSSPPVCRIKETSTLYSGLAALCPRVLLTIQQCHPRNLTVSGFRGVSPLKQSPHTLLSSSFQATGIRGTPCTRLSGRSDELLGPLNTTLQSQTSTAVCSERSMQMPGDCPNISNQSMNLWVVSLQLLLTSV